MLARLFLITQRVLPRHLLTALVYRITRIRIRAVKNFLIRRFVRLLGVAVEELDREVPEGYASLNDFFTRELKAGARPIDADPAVVCSPVDGAVSTLGRLLGESIVQAKGIDYSLVDLLASDIDDARLFSNGACATLYLAPHNYHRVHAPVDGELVSARYVPGDLYSVNRSTVALLSGLFHRNERLILRFATEHGPLAVVLVGALNVGSITTPWTGELRPKKRGVVEAIALDAAPTALRKGDLLGWFNMGSTVILLLPEEVCSWNDDLVSGSTVSMGAGIGRLGAADAE